MERKEFERLIVGEGGKRAFSGEVSRLNNEFVVRTLAFVTDCERD